VLQALSSGGANQVTVLIYPQEVLFQDSNKRERLLSYSHGHKYFLLFTCSDGAGRQDCEICNSVW